MLEFGIILNFLHYFINRFFVIPLGFIVGLGWWGAFAIALFGDIVQMFLYFYILEGAGVNKKLGRIIAKRFPTQDKVERTKMVRKVRGLGYMGTTILAAMPVYFGGMYSAVLVSHLMHLNRKKSYVFLTIGSIIGSAVLVFGLQGLIALWNLIKSLIT
ncbi:MAG: small multi-drug export protein [Elusimicrobiota bacterium]|nr:small multi-drug export protein [Elusimicrobiota bacterium]